MVKYGWPSTGTVIKIEMLQFGLEKMITSRLLVVLMQTEELLLAILCKIAMLVLQMTTCSF